MTYPLENLFRPAVERYAALAALAAASGVIAWPQVLMLTPGAGLVVAALLFAHALRREARAERVLRFQRHLRQPPHYVLAADRIPWSGTNYFSAVVSAGPRCIPSAWSTRAGRNTRISASRRSSIALCVASRCAMSTPVWRGQRR